MQFSSQINWFLCNCPDGPLKASGRLAVSRSFSVEDVRTSKQHRPNARSSYSKFYTELEFSRHCLRSFCKTSGRRGNTSRCFPSVSEYFGFPLRTRKGVTVKTVWMLGQAVRTWSYYEKNHVILKMQLQKTVWTRLTSVRTPIC
jgi:hypothetical protein